MSRLQSWQDAGQGTRGRVSGILKMMLLDDVHSAGMFHAVLLRSPVAKGKIKEIHFPQTPRGIEVIGPKALGGNNRFLDTGMPLLADTEVSYVGEPLAIIVAPSEIEAEDYAAECSARIEDESPAYSIETFTKDTILEEYHFDTGALFSDAALFGSSEAAGANGAAAAAGAGAGGENGMSAGGENGAADASGAGSVGAGTAAGGTGANGCSVGNTYQTGIQYHWPCEPCGAAAQYHGDGITVTVAAADACLIYKAVAAALGMAPAPATAAETPAQATAAETPAPATAAGTPAPGTPAETAALATAAGTAAGTAQIIEYTGGNLKINLLPAGIHFDLKTLYPAQIACYAALAASITKKNVRLLLTRDEEMLYCPKRPRSRFHISSRIDAEGILQKTKIEARYDYGAWNLWKAGNKERSPLQSGFTLMRRVYNLGEIEAAGIAVRTSLPPSGPFCGGGVSQAFFALENHVSSVADALSSNALDWRLENLTKNPSVLSPENRAALITLLERAGELSGFRRKQAAYKALAAGTDDKIISRRGIGLALASLTEGAGNPPETARVPLLAVAVVEIEIDKIAYIPLMRNIWFIVAVPSAESPRTAPHAGARRAQAAFTKHQQRALRRAIIQGMNAALGWAMTEKLEYVNGRLEPDISSEYKMLSPGETPGIHIEFVESAAFARFLPFDGDAASPEAARFAETMREAPFHAAPSAFLQAVSQAVSHEFVKIPLSPANIWNFLQKRGAIA